MPCKAEVYLCELRFLDRVFCLCCRYGYAEHSVVDSAEQLTILVEGLFRVIDAEVYECLAIACEIDRLSFDGAVRVDADIVTVVELFCLFQAKRLDILSYDSDESLPDCIHVVNVSTVKRIFLWNVQFEFPAVVEDEPVIGGLFVDERSLPVRSVVADVLERGRNNAVKV